MLAAWKSISTPLRCCEQRDINKVEERVNGTPQKETPPLNSIVCMIWTWGVVEAFHYIDSSAFFILSFDLSFRGVVVALCLGVCVRLSRTRVCFDHLCIFNGENRALALTHRGTRAHTVLIDQGIFPARASQSGHYIKWLKQTKIECECRVDAVSIRRRPQSLSSSLTLSFSISLTLSSSLRTIR